MTWKELLISAEFWAAMSVLAALLPGPQTRVLPALLRGLAQALRKPNT